MQDIQPDYEFYAFQPPLTEVSVSRILKDTLNNKSFTSYWDARSKMKLSGSGHGQQAYSVSWLTPGNEDAKHHKLRYQLSFKRSCEIARSDFEMTVYAGDSTTQRPDLKPDILWKPNVDGRDSLMLTYDFTKVEPNRGEWRCYRVVLQMGAHSLKPPSWVADWSTEDDTGLRKSEKTLHLDLLIELLLHACTERTPCYEQYLSFGREYCRRATFHCRGWVSQVAMARSR